ncbi:hypothetical protein LB506_002236 [Fusarium annulatum]|nr:hypothetical protein LB506_002236 [Fusarium annulatum]
MDGTITIATNGLTMRRSSCHQISTSVAPAHRFITRKCYAACQIWHHQNPRALPRVIGLGISPYCQQISALLGHESITESKSQFPPSLASQATGLASLISKFPATTLALAIYTKSGSDIILALLGLRNDADMNRLTTDTG